MSPTERLTDCRVAILGLGLMGGSLALALRGRVARLSGYDPDPQTLLLAQEQGVVDQLGARPGDILPQADLVILAAPVAKILDLIGELPFLHPGEAMVLDLGSTKTAICRAMETMPPRFDPLGGHPMCGKEVLGLQNAEAGLFQDAAFAFTPLARTSPRACTLAGELATAVGSHPLWVEAETHDRWAASTSHMPYLLSVALTLATPEEAAPLVGPGFRSMARLAGTPASMMGDVLLVNRGEVQSALERLRMQLSAAEQVLAGGDEGVLDDWLARGAAKRSRLLAARQGGDA